MNLRDRQIGFFFSDIARFRHNLFDQFLKPVGLTHAQAFVLNYLLQSDGLTQVELAERMEIGTVTVSGLVDRLEKRGLVKRKVNPKDRRAKQVWLTQKAHEMWLEMNRQFTKVNDVSFEGFTNEEFDELCELLRRVRGNLSEELERN